MGCLRTVSLMEISVSGAFPGLLVSKICLLVCLIKEEYKPKFKTFTNI